MNELHHFVERRAGKKDFVHAFATHGGRVLMCDRSAAAAEHFDVGRAFLAQEIDNSREELGMSAVVIANANHTHCFLDIHATQLTEESSTHIQTNIDS